MKDELYNDAKLLFGIVLLGKVLAVLTSMEVALLTIATAYGIGLILSYVKGKK
jgi:hypothetical protein